MSTEITDHESGSEYVLPVDIGETDRLNYQHHLLCKTFGGLYRAPLDKLKVHRVLDLGCGTGIWTKAFAREYPDAQVVGVDIHESAEWDNAPINCTFITADMEFQETWTRFRDKFDFIHGRFIVIGVRSWPALLSKAFEYLESGGYFEIQDLYGIMRCEDDVLETRSKMLQWAGRLQDAMQRIGLSPYALDLIPGVLAGIGFDNKSSDTFRMIIGPWPVGERDGDLGRMGLENFKMGVRGFSDRLFTKVYGWSPEQHEKCIREVLKEADEQLYRMYVPMKVIVAQRR